MVCTLIVLDVHFFMRCRKAWFRDSQWFRATQKPVTGAPPDGGDPRRWHQRRPGQGVASEECNYAPEAHARVGSMTERGLILFLFKQSRTLQ